VPPLAKIALTCIVATALLLPNTTASQAPAPTTSTTSTTSTTTTTTTTTLPPITVMRNATCGQWWTLAHQVGFDDTLLPTLDRIIHRESRCDASQFNATDPNGGSHGLTQINGFWCKPSRYYPLGYLQTAGVLADCIDLYDPTINLRAALALVAYSRSMSLCAWHQWAWLDPCED
jgi:hypothetical protein